MSRREAAPRLRPWVWLTLAALPGIACAQVAQQPLPAGGEIRKPAAKHKASARTAKRSSKKANRKLPSRQGGQAATAVAPLRAGDLASRTAAELDALLAEQRKVVRTAPRNETARHNLGWLSLEAANRLLKAQSLGRANEVADYATLIRTSLADTLWRVTQLVREDPARAQAALGLYYTDGILVPADPLRGCDYFARAARAGQAEAAYRASQCVTHSNPEQARRWLEQSAAGGNAAAQETLGRACIEGASVDAACAKKWLRPAAAQGRVSAVSVLAWLYAREGTTESLSQAATLYKNSAEAGDFAAQNNLGELYETGRGVAREPAQALVWYRRSAEGGFAPAQFNLARLLAFGIGTERDAAAAREWALKAQGQGIAQADELLKLIAQAAR